LQKDFRDKIRIIGVSTDKKEDDVIPHINDCGWLEVEQYQVDEELKKLHPLTQYKMLGVPHLLLVDRRGQVVFKGLPSYRPDI